LATLLSDLPISEIQGFRLVGDRHNSILTISAELDDTMLDMIAALAGVFLAWIWKSLRADDDNAYKLLNRQRL